MLKERYMDQDSNGIFVARNERGAFVRVVGRGTFQNAQCLRQFGLEAIEEGCPAISLDLSGCKAMDSTFLGVLASAGMKMAEAQKNANGPRIELFQPSKRVLDLLDNLGVAHLFTLVESAKGLPEKYQSIQTVACNASREQLSHTCLEAHQALMALNPANIPRFKEVTKFLQEDLAKLKSSKS